jgi:glycosyltransferase involved in cell wall biosynthesis
MTHVLHLFDADCDWEERVGVAQMLDRLDVSQHRQWLASLDPRVPYANWFADETIDRVPVRFDWAPTSTPALNRLISRYRIDVVHAWGMQAAAAAVAVDRKISLVVGRFNPAVSQREANLLRTISSSTSSFAVACSSGTVRRRLVEAGVPAEKCVVIRPGVDFGAINAAKKNRSLRSDLGVGDDDRLVIAAAPVTRVSGHERLVWAAHLLNYIAPTLRLIVYGRSSECERLGEIAANAQLTIPVFRDRREHRYEDLIAIGDAMVIAPTADVTSTPAAWAMAAGVPVIGSAVYSVAELIAHKHNGRLIKPDRSSVASTRIAAELRQIGDMSKETETARGQAYEVFGIRRFVDQHVQLYDNLRRRKSPDENIVDSAVSA